MLLKLRTQLTPFIENPISRNPYLRVALAIGYTFLLTLVLLQSSARPVVGPVAPVDYNLGWEIFLTSGHLIGFSLLVILIWSALTTVMSSNRALIVAVVFACSLGLITEILQSFVPDRSASLFDLACDWSVAFIIGYIIHRLAAPFGLNAVTSKPE